jgi:Ca-activated chloride channel homolog
MRRILCWLLVTVALSGPLSAQSARKRVRDGNRLYQEKKYDQALTKYQDALLSDPDNPRIRFNVGDALYRNQKLDKALEEYRKAVASQDPGLESQAWFNMGNTLYRMGKLKESLPAYKQALKLNPDDMDAKHNLEFVRRMLKKNAMKQPRDGEGRQKESDQQDPQPSGSGEDRESGKQEEGEPKEADRKRPDSKPESTPDSGSSSESPENPSPSGKAEQGAPMSCEEAARLLNALKNDEKYIQKMRKKIATKRARIKKDWAPQ